VTDYSSAMYEFALLGRPIAFFTPDADRYVEERGFYLDFPADLPGPAFTRSEDLAAYLRAGVFDLDRVRGFAASSFDVADGRATERFVREVVGPALERAPGGAHAIGDNPPPGAGTETPRDSRDPGALT